MKSHLFLRIAAVILFTAITFPKAYAADVLVGRDQITGDPSSGIQFDANADGSNEVVFNPDGSIKSNNADERIVGQFGEYIDFNDEGDGKVCVGGQRGSVQTSLCISMDDTEIRLYSPKDNSIWIDDNVTVWAKRGEPTNLTVQSNGSQDAKALFSEGGYTRGEIYSQGKTNSFRINSHNPAGLHLNGDTKYNVSVASGGGMVAIGHDQPVSELDLNGALTLRNRTSEPANPPEGSAVIWMTNDGIMVKATLQGKTRKSTLLKM